ncbi:hypothetical protein R1T16_13515 [Flavobacterium sp. DG1-102-2]|uniref:hypothetical protein n=1 Tax=Flavobacterium sp. DG1-102-2 TaxID=3081663 RepID=UPI002949542A|nr:hypothetical protein [Flavobacterium sp. DG1-102-2]MDV6169448.1 hypothetical protein [Flavobacterium sp. DG1-102-2]
MLPLFLLAVTVTGCSDDDGGSTSPAKQGTLTCKINGVARDFSYMVSANDKPSEEVVHFVTISGHEEDDFTSPGFGFQLVSEEGATTTTYTSADSELHGTYYIQNLDSNGNITGTTTYHGNGSDGTSFTMKVTTLNEWGVEGTFSGVLQLTGGEEYVTITDGVFSAPYNGN